MKIINQKGVVGQNGRHGRPGQGGKNGPLYRGIYLESYMVSSLRGYGGVNYSDESIWAVKSTDESGVRSGGKNFYDNIWDFTNWHPSTWWSSAKSGFVQVGVGGSLRVFGTGFAHMAGGVLNLVTHFAGSGILESGNGWIEEVTYIDQGYADGGQTQPQNQWSATEEKAPASISLDVKKAERNFQELYTQNNGSLLLADFREKYKIKF